MSWPLNFPDRYNPLHHDGSCELLEGFFICECGLRQQEEREHTDKLQDEMCA